MLIKFKDFVRQFRLFFSSPIYPYDLSCAACTSARWQRRAGSTALTSCGTPTWHGRDSMAACLASLPSTTGLSLHLRSSTLTIGTSKREGEYVEVYLDNDKVEIS